MTKPQDLMAVPKKISFFYLYYSNHNNISYPTVELIKIDLSYLMKMLSSPILMTLLYLYVSYLQANVFPEKMHTCWLIIVNSNPTGFVREIRTQ